MALVVMLGCSPQVEEESSKESSRIHNEKAIDHYLHNLIKSPERRFTGFTESARWGRIDLVKEFLAQGVGVDATDEYGRTALILAASGGQLDVMQLLIEEGADVNFQEPESRTTPLLALLRSLHSESTYYSGAQLLIDSGAVTTLQDSDGWTAVDWAKSRIREGRVDQDFLQEFEPQSEPSGNDS